ncbi:MAG: hypothetical protein AMXMBFR53_19990 [Gemmatimonadota bacterium]
MAAWLLVTALWAASPALAQDAGQGAARPGPPWCAGGLLSRIEVRNHSLFAPEDIRHHRFAWALGLANWAHVRTRADYLRNELLVDEGDCYDPARVGESVRLIRDLDFIARVEATPRRLADSTWALHVETWDEWTTQVGVDFDVESQLQFKGFYVTEKNLLGRGLRLSFRYRDFRERDDRSLQLSTTRFLGTRANASVGAGTTRTGGFFLQEVSYPFVSEAGRWSLDTRFHFEDREYSYLTGNHAAESHLLFPLQDLDGRVRVARRFGAPGALVVVGAEVNGLDRTVAGPALRVYRGAFDGAAPATDSLAARLAGQDEPLSFVEVGATVGLRRIRFGTGQGLDRVSGVQNVAMGSELLLTLGHSVATWGNPGAYSWGRVDGFAGWAGGPVVANASVQAEGRLRDGAAGSASRWRDLALRGRGVAYLQPGPGTSNTLLAGLRFDLRRNVDLPFQQALGGEEGVRSYREDEVPVGSSLVAYAEHRLNLDWFHPAVDAGFVLFGDLGRGWGSGVPFGIDTGWRAAVGGGLRLGFPAGTGSVTRLELAWPVGGPDAGRAPVFRTYWAPSLTSR